MKNKRSNLETKHNISGYGFLSLWLIGFLVFTVYPLFYSLYLSFNDVRLTVRGWETSFVGFANYTSTFLLNTTYMPAIIEFIVLEVVYVPTILIISFILALLLSKDIKFRAAFRMIYFLPVIVLSGPVMYQLISSDSTRVDDISESAIFMVIERFSQPFAEFLVLLFENMTLILWFTGIPIILFINGLRKIPKSLYEAAEIDGANGWQILWKIKIPLIKPIALVTGIYSVISLGLYEINPTYELLNAVLANTAGGMGIASTFAWIYTVVILLLIGALFLVFKEKKVVYVETLKQQQNQKELKRLQHQRNDRFRDIFSIEKNVDRIANLFKKGMKDDE